MKNISQFLYVSFNLVKEKLLKKVSTICTEFIKLVNLLKTFHYHIEIKV